MNVGKMTDARDHDFTTFFSLRLFMSSIRPRRRASTNGPFLTERDIGFLLPYLRCRERTMSRPVVLDLRALAHVPGTAGLAKVLVVVVEVADLADGGHAAHRHAPHLAGRQADGGE